VVVGEGKVNSSVTRVGEDVEAAIDTFSGRGATRLCNTSTAFNLTYGYTNIEYVDL